MKDKISRSLVFLLALSILIPLTLPNKVIADDAELVQTIIDDEFVDENNETTIALDDLSEQFEEPDNLETQVEETPSTLAVKEINETENTNSNTKEELEDLNGQEEPEEIHTLMYYSDQEADLETAANWEETFNHVKLTGNWTKDLVAIAKSQVGYIESEKNYIVIEDEDGNKIKKGYSRYGAWYGDPYGDWSGMFVSFSLHYAGADEFPKESDAQRWITRFKADQVWEDVNSYIPKQGDILFFDDAQVDKTQHIGIVENFDESTQTIYTIEGDSNNSVALQEYTLNDSTIIGYCSMEDAIREYAPSYKLEYEGEDYTIVAHIPKEADLPKNVELSVRELFDAEYEDHYQRAMDAMGIEEIHFVRFFDINFLVNGEEIEPAAPIQIEITYLNNLDLKESQVSGVVHFANTGTEVLDADTEQNDNGETSFTFTQDSFSVTGTIFGATLMSDGIHPQGVITGTIGVNDIILYNLDGTGDTIAPLSGVGYTIWNKATGTVVATGVTTDNFALNMGEINDHLIEGETYTIEQTSVPEGYAVFPQTKEFKMTGGKIDPTLGVFYNYKKDGGYGVDKTAQVIDYVNRIYQVDLSADSGDYKYNINHVNFSLVVDQSNSMLFPAQLTEGPIVNLKREPDNGTFNNNPELNEKLTDKNEIYYLINDDIGATVYAIWWNDNLESWYYQDASYYAKAQGMAGVNNNTDNDGNEVIFADETASTGQVKGTGGSFGSGFKVTGSSTNGKDYRIYTSSDPYNRLHYLQEATMILVNSLAALDDTNTSVTVTTFASGYGSCVTSDKLNANGIQTLQNAINTLTTRGGTHPAEALNHLVTGVHDNHGAHLKVDQKDIVILITDGAPTTEANQEAALDAAKAVKHVSNTTLYTVGLATENVAWAKDHLWEMATSRDHSFESEDSSELAKFLIGDILSKSADKEFLSADSSIIDVISESFYPVDKDGKALTNGTILHLDGSVCENPLDHEGTTNYATVKYDKDIGWYVEWENQTLPTKTSENKWQGKIYLKAKEDFIGGNAIDTNKSATVTILEKNGEDVLSSIELPSPNVNVRLLQMEEWSAESTVFLGDEIDPGTDGGALSGVLKDFFEKMAFTKLDEYDGAIYHKYGAGTEGLTPTEFALSYALNDLTEDQWTQLVKGTAVTIPYTYDDASSHGPVGDFTLQIRKIGDNAGFENHATQDVGINVETYYLDVTYKARSLSERNMTNEHIASGESPGIEVGTGTALENGAGTIQVKNEYKVNVIDGVITLTKKIDSSLVSTDDQTFEFTLYKLTQGPDGEEINEKYKTGAITVPARSTEGISAQVEDEAINDEGILVFEHLPRGEYLVEESSDDNYRVKSFEVITNGTDTTNSYYEAEADDISIVFHIGSDLKNKDVIIHPQDAPQIKDRHMTYSWASGYEENSIADEDVRNFSRGVLIFTNRGFNELPKTGGNGTNMFLISGLAIIIGGLMIGGYYLFRNKKKKNSKLMQILGVFLSLAILMIIGINAITVKADDIKTDIDITIHKRLFDEETATAVQNTGSEMDFAGEPLAGVEFQAFDVTSKYYDLVANGLQEEALQDLQSQYSGTLKDKPLAVGVTDAKGEVTFNLPMKQGEQNAVYVFAETKTPQGIEITKKATPMVIALPLYAMNSDGSFTDEILKQVHLYPKNIGTLPEKPTEPDKSVPTTTKQIPKPPTTGEGSFIWNIIGIVLIVFAVILSITALLYKRRYNKHS